MKAQKNIELAKAPKKPNIPLRRKLRIYYGRALITLKVFAATLLCLLIFTKQLDFLKHSIAQHLYEYTADSGLVLDRVMVEGQKNIPTDEIVANLNADVGTPILSIHLNDVRSKLGKNDWVKDVVLERRLPSTIYIGISEREPIAILQQDKKLYLVDNEGHIIQSNMIEKFAGLLQVVGSDAHLHAAALLSSLAEDLELRKKVMSAVRYGERRWNLILDEGLIVKMPETGFAQAYKYLGQLHKNDKLFGKNYKSIDLRDTAKYYFEKYPQEKADKK
jgi:cell division protein FtsQ